MTRRARSLAARILRPDYAHDPDLPAAVQVVIWLTTAAVGTWVVEAWLAGVFGGAR